jgi:conjugative relaxase-like TrwC/TraI family protein
VPVAGIITISPGHDASYPWRQIGTTADITRSMHQATDYYLSPAAKGGEPPGRWHGAGLEMLGFREGHVIDRAVFEQLYGQFVDPHDPAGQARLGRMPQRFRAADEIYATLAALEPAATAERRAELMTEARTQVRTPVQYFDATFSVSKSITLLHASALASAARAAEEGDLAAAALWGQAADRVWAAIQAGNAAALEYLQREAGYTRSGYHGRQEDGITTGRWEDAHGFIVGSFAQHTSRDGDPQLHIHNLILNRVMRERDGAWRTLDSRALHEYRGAASAIASLVMESELSREFGVGWVRRADGHGREVAGVSAKLMAQFSSRRQSISALTARLAVEFEAQHGYAPDARALGKLRQWANHASRAAKDDEPLDIAAEVRRWAAQARVGEAGALEPVLSAVSNRPGAGAAGPAPEPVRWLSAAQEQELMAQALARVQQAQPTWRKADLIRHLGELLPDHVACADGKNAVRLLPALADRVLAGAGGQQVLTLEAPDWPRAPEALRRADGRSVYRPHGATRYATQDQLLMEERLTIQARQPGAPRIEPELAARLLGADQAQLEAQLRPGGHARADPADVEQPKWDGPGLRLDQAAAAYLAVTSDRRTEILVGPAGSGKTRTAGQIARLWREAGMGEVHGLATSQAARNVLHDAGVHLASNTALFLQRLAGGPPGREQQVRPGTLLLLDEASMMSITDLAAIMNIAVDRGCRVLITGDHEQLAAVEGGGGMLMLTRQLGYAQLTEPVRFSQRWERDASLRLRAGDASVLTVYDQQGRLRGGDVEESMEQACRAWLADHLNGHDTLLLARTEEQARELSRRVRDYLVRYGHVSTDVEIGLRHGAIASRGDLIMARQNDRRIIAGARGRWLTNRDVLCVEQITGRSVTVRRMTGRDKQGKPTWSARFDLPRTYHLLHCDLAYATTTHAAQGRTTGICHLFVDGLGDRQGLYVGMSRGWLANYAYCATGPRADNALPGSRPAPELARADRIARLHAGIVPSDPVLSRSSKPETRQHPVSVMAGSLGRDGTVMSATETVRRELSQADHLGALSSIWYDLVRRAQITRYEQLLRAHLSEADADSALTDPACTWLWRTLREAELAGQDADGVLSSVIAGRSLRGSRHVARVVDARIRRAIDYATPRPRPPWSQQIPETGDPEMDRYLTELAHAMDDRITRIGDHIAETRPSWATNALGQPPEDPVQRAAWTARAAQLGAYRELYGYSSPADAIGPEPGRTSPDARAAWHTAFAALGSIDGVDLRGCTDGQLHLHRAIYQQQTSWAPPYVAEDLRLARLQARTAHENRIHEEQERRATSDPDAASRHKRLAAAWRDMHAKATGIVDALASAHWTRQQWEVHTEPARQLALAANRELRRRHPRQVLEPVQSAEPTSNGPAPPSPPDDRVERNTNRSEPAGQQVMPGAGNLAWSVIQERIVRISQDARAAQAKLDHLGGMPIPIEDTEALDLGSARKLTSRRERDAIVQPARPDIAPASEVLRRSEGRCMSAIPEAENS